MLNNKKTIGSIIITVVIIGAIVLFWINRDSKTNNSNSNNNIENEQEQQQLENKTEEKIDIDDVELEDYEGITKSGIIVDERLTLNGYKFILGTDIDKFIEGTKTVVEDDDKLNAFRTNTNQLLQELKCYIKDNDNKIDFEITVGHDDSGNTVIREINIDSNAKYANSNFLADPNIVSCGFSFLGGIDINDSFSEISKELISSATYTEDSYGKNYKLNLKTKRGPFYNITVSASTKDKTSDFYYIDYVLVTNVNY